MGGQMTLKWILNKLGLMVSTGYGHGSAVLSGGHGNNSSGSIEGWEFLDEPNN
jgi:hypothetical protein